MAPKAVCRLSSLMTGVSYTIMKKGSYLQRLCQGAAGEGRGRVHGGCGIYTQPVISLQHVARRPVHVQQVTESWGLHQVLGKTTTHVSTDGASSVLCTPVHLQQVTESGGCIRHWGKQVSRESTDGTRSVPCTPVHFQHITELSGTQ